MCVRERERVLMQKEMHVCVKWLKQKKVTTAGTGVWEAIKKGIQNKCRKIICDDG